MKSLNENGVSTCQAGQENYVYFNLMPRLRKKSRYCQYDYRHTDGELFATVAPTLDICQERRNEWLQCKKESVK
nr:DUF3873 family protein [uncultured Bacteroides sp.]